MRAAERRRVSWVVDDLAAGKVSEAIVVLCRMIGRMDIPECHQRATPQLVRANTEGPKAFTVPRSAATRVKNPDVLAAYRKAWPFCQLIGCFAPAEPHHIQKRSLGGSDAEANLVALCRAHHDAWHALGPDRWLQVYHATLTGTVRKKIVGALLHQLAEEA